MCKSVILFFSGAKNLKVRFEDNDLAELYTKGFSDAYKEVTNKDVEDLRKTIFMAAMAKCWEDIINYPPYEGILISDKQCNLFFGSGWQLELSIKFLDEGNKVYVVSLSKKDKE